MSGVDYEKKSFSVTMGTSEISEEERASIAKANQERVDAEREDFLKREDEKMDEYNRGVQWLLDNNFFEPLNDRVLVVPEKVSSFGNKTKDVVNEVTGKTVKLLLADEMKKNAKKATNKGVVIAVGPGLQLPSGEFIRPNVDKGDTIMYEQFGYSELYLIPDGDLKEILCHVTRAGDILGRSKHGDKMAGF